MENAGPAAATAEGAGANDARALTDALSVLQARHVQELRHALHDGQQASRSTLAFASTAKPAADPMHLQIRRGEENAAVRGGCARRGRRRGRRSEVCRAAHAGGDALTVLGSLRRCSTAGSKTCRAGPWRRVSARELGGCKGSRARHVEMRERPHRHKTSSAHSLIVS